MAEDISRPSDASKHTKVAGVNSRKRKRGQPEGTINRGSVSNQSSQSRQKSNSQHSNGHGNSVSSQSNHSRQHSNSRRGSVSNRSNQSRQRSISQHSNSHPVNVSPRPGYGGPGHAAGRSDQNQHPHRRARDPYPARMELPVWNQKDIIRQALSQKDVLLLVGETGSGKSTQVPQMLRNQPWCRPRNVTISNDQSDLNALVGGCIAVTEPRRVAAISLAKRVADEMNTPLGQNSRVGYSVRFDKSTSPKTQIKYLTEGMLLQEMIKDPWLRAYSAVIVDEVHERSINVDLVLGFLRQMLAGKNEGRGRIPLKVVVMSATAEMDKLQAFFEEGYTSALGASTGIRNANREANFDQHGDQDKAAESERDGVQSSPNRTHSNRVKSITPTQNIGHKRISTEAAGINPINGHSVNGTSKQTSNVATCHIQGRQYSVQIEYAKEPVPDIVDASLRTIFGLHRREPDGDVLVFLTGQETVESLASLVNEYATGLAADVPKIQVHTLFAALPQSDQQRVFEKAPAKTRKVIIATNIAETSVTVPGVKYVIDCGKAKVTHYRPKIGRVERAEKLLVNAGDSIQNQRIFPWRSPLSRKFFVVTSDLPF